MMAFSRTSFICEFSNHSYIGIYTKYGYRIIHYLQYGLYTLPTVWLPHYSLPTVWLPHYSLPTGMVYTHVWVLCDHVDG